MGPALNGLKDRIGEAIAVRRAVLKEQELARRLEEERLDVTLPVRPSPLETGRIHPVSQVIDEITAIFADMGFAVAEGPDIETDYYNFTALNFPPGHPAREMHDTFFFNPRPDGERMLLRTHTSPVQIRTMETQKPPIRVIIPGRTYRIRLRPDAHADVPPGRRAGDRRDQPSRPSEMGAGGVLQGLLRGRRGADALPADLLSRSPSRRSRSTSAAAAIGNEIRFGEGDDWLEILGCGMVHPNVIRARRARPRQVPGLRLGHGDRPHRHAQIRHAGPPRLLRRRHPLADALRLPAARLAVAVRGADVVNVAISSEKHP